MKLRIISFTKKGMEQSRTIQSLFLEEDVQLYTKCSSNSDRDAEILYVQEPLEEWTRRQFEKGVAFVFIGACGIAVRAIAPCVQSKLHDSAVLVMDEQGQYVIPILSGHVGGANELANRIATKMGATAVITTATDLNQKFAVDLFAKKNHLHILNKDGIVKISAKVLEGDKVTCSIAPKYWSEEKLPAEWELEPYPPVRKVGVLISDERIYEADLKLIPKEYVIGVGCRKGKEADQIADFLERHLQAVGITEEQVLAVTSIDLKREEEGLLLWCRNRGIPFHTYSAEELKKVEGIFSQSDFVKRTTGVDNVCERAALKECGKEGKLIYKKHAEDGMTIAVARMKRSVQFCEK